MTTDGSGYDDDILKINGERVIAIHTQDTATFSKITIDELAGHGHVVDEEAKVMQPRP